MTVEVLASDVRRTIVDQLASRAAAVPGFTGVSAQELADLLKLHVTSIRFHLEVLQDAGLIQAMTEHAGRKGRPRVLYRLTSATAELTHQRRLLSALVNGWTSDGPGTPEAVGRRWAYDHLAPSLAGSAPATDAATWRARVGHTVDHLADWGYRTRVEVEGAEAHVDIDDCPFLTLAQDRPEVICALHRGLLEGAMAFQGERDTRLDLEPFVTPTRCHVRIRPGTALPTTESSLPTATATGEPR